jgi:PAS domain-containing protein
MNDKAGELGKLAVAIDKMTERLLLRETDRKKAEKDLKKLKERFELAANAANIGIWDWHIRNNSLIWDKNMFKLYGVAPEEFDYRLEGWKS